MRFVLFGAAFALLLAAIWKITYTEHRFLDFAISTGLVENKHFMQPFGFNFSTFCQQDWDRDSKRFANRTLLIFENESYTYEQMDAYAHILAAELKQRFALRPGDVVVSAIELRPAGLVVLLACQLLGAIHAPMSPFLGESEVRAVSDTIGEVAAVVVTGGLPEQHWRAASSRVVVWSLQSVVPHAGSPRVMPHVWALDATVALFSTSGSSGTPKLVETAWRAYTRFGNYCDAHPWRMLLTAGWEAGSVVGVFYKHLLQGRTFVLTVDHSSRVCTPAAARHWAELIVKHSVQALMLYPPAALAFIDVDVIMPSVKHLTIGGQASSRSVCEKVQHLFPSALWIHGYAMTELRLAGSANFWHPRYSKTFQHNFFHSVGRPWKTNMHHLKIVPDSTVPAEAGYPVGDIRIRVMYHAFKGYWRNPELTAKAYDENGFYLTKDLGYIDNKGFLYIVGRQDDVIKHSITGKQIFPHVVEDAFHSHPEVRHVGVVAKRDSADTGDLVVACVVVQGNISATDLRVHISQNLSTWQMPSIIYFMDSLPMTNTGKVARKQLKQMVKGME